MVTKIGLDLGYANITISDTTAGVYREQSVALIDKNSRRIISVGNSAIEQGEELSSSAVLQLPDLQMVFLLDRLKTACSLTDRLHRV